MGLFEIGQQLHRQVTQRLLPQAPDVRLIELRQILSRELHDPVGGVLDSASALKSFTA